VQSVLANVHPCFSVIVVDQSKGDESEAAIADLRTDARLSYIRSNTVGLSRSRNIGLKLAKTSIVAFTDDDCEVPETWLEVMQGVFEEHANVALSFCSVAAGPHDLSQGFVPVYQCHGTRVVSTVRGKCRARGMGAGLAARRDVLLELNGFDEELGAGGRFPSCEDGDMAIRVLLAGYELCETDRTCVIHHGFRSWPEVRLLARRDWTGIGAAYAKPIRAGRWDFAPVPFYELFAKALQPPVNDLLHLRRPRGFMWSLHFLRGFSQGLLAPFDRQRLLFKPSSD
jgi:glycosyltransferase involved in cell wall biosynthesis